MSDTKKHKRLFRHWPTDIIYAVIVVLISGVIGRGIANMLSDTIATYITAGVLTMVISIVLMLLVPFVIRWFFRDEMDEVTSSMSDFLLCCVMILLISFLCRDLIGPAYLTDAIFAIIGLAVSYFCLLDKAVKRIKKAV